MHSLPPDFDASAFTGTELVQVSFSANTVHLVFETDVQMTIVGPFFVQVHCGLPPVRYSPPVESSSLMALIGKRVVSASGDADGTLTLQFENGGKIICIDESKNYESYTLIIGGREIIV
jgi:Family of unknown function (DUF6188)